MEYETVLFSFLSFPAAELRILCHFESKSSVKMSGQHETDYSLMGDVTGYVRNKLTESAGVFTNDTANHGSTDSEQFFVMKS